MKKSLLAVSFAAVAAVAAVGSTGLASAAPIPQSAQFSSIGTDGGSCGNSWALDLSSRQFSQPLPDPAGNYAIVEKFIDGHFSAVGGVSPGACNGAADGTGFTTNNGHTVREGLHGSWSGNEHVFVTTNGGTFSLGDGSCNGHATSDTNNPCTTASYVAYHYGGAATISVTSFLFNYHTGDKLALGSKAWTEKGDVHVFAGAEVDTGDIYTS